MRNDELLANGTTDFWGGSIAPFLGESHRLDGLSGGETLITDKAPDDTD